MATVQASTLTADSPFRGDAHISASDQDPTREPGRSIADPPHPDSTHLRDEPPLELPDRQRQVLSLVARGYTTREIAETLELSPHTVKHYVERICENLGSLNRTAAVATYLRENDGDLELIVDLTRVAEPPPREAGRRTLSPRQLEILRLLAEGQSTAEIAEALSLSPHTVRTHVWRILLRLGARNRREAVFLSRFLLPPVHDRGSSDGEREDPTGDGPPAR